MTDWNPSIHNQYDIHSCSAYEFSILWLKTTRVGSFILSLDGNVCELLFAYPLKRNAFWEGQDDILFIKYSLHQIYWKLTKADQQQNTHREHNEWTKMWRKNYVGTVNFVESTFINNFNEWISVNRNYFSVILILWKLIGRKTDESSLMSNAMECFATKMKEYCCKELFRKMERAGERKIEAFFFWISLYISIYNKPLFFVQTHSFQNWKEKKNQT